MCGAQGSAVNQLPAYITHRHVADVATHLRFGALFAEEHALGLATRLQRVDGSSSEEETRCDSMSDSLCNANPTRSRTLVAPAAHVRIDVPFRVPALDCGARGRVQFRRRGHMITVCTQHAMQGYGHCPRASGSADSRASVWPVYLFDAHLTKITANPTR